MGVEQRHKFWLYPLVPNLFVFAAEAEKEGSKGGEEDNCRAFEATTPGNCDRQLWQNKNGQVYSHGIIVLANGSTSRALLRTTGLSFWFFLLEGEAEKIFSFFLTRFFPRPFWRGRNKRLQHQQQRRHTKEQKSMTSQPFVLWDFFVPHDGQSWYTMLFLCLLSKSL